MVSEPSPEVAEGSGDLDRPRDPSGFTRFDDPAIEAATGTITRFHVVDAIAHRIVATCAEMPDGTVCATPLHPETAEPIPDSTILWGSLDEYREAVTRRGWYVTFEDPPEDQR